VLLKDLAPGAAPQSQGDDAAAATNVAPPSEGASPTAPPAATQPQAPAAAAARAEVTPPQVAAQAQATTTDHALTWLMNVLILMLALICVRIATR
jgi:hypothetical protein